MRPVVACAVALLALAEAGAAQQIGLRMDATTSMQWNGSRIYLESADRSVVQTKARQIHDVWPGPVSGTFAVSTDQGLGILIGSGLTIGGMPFGRDAVLRSSRFDAIWVMKRSDGVTTIVELHEDGLGREVYRTPRTLVDFDVDQKGRIVFLTNDGGIGLIVDEESEGMLALPPELAGAKRIFVDANTEEIAVYAPTRVGRYNTGTRKWAFANFIEQTDALVRHAVTRRVGIEPKFE